MISTLSLIVLLATATGQAGDDQNTGNGRGELPTSDKVREAVGLAGEALARERQEILEERRRLENLREEIRKEIQALTGDSSENTLPAEEARLRAQQARALRIKHIAKGLAAMAPVAAAVALARMDDNQAIELLGVMDGKQVGKILESMNAERAANLMQSMIGRNPLLSTGPAGKGISQ